MAPIDLISCLISDELTRPNERLLDRLLHHGHVLKRRPRSWRTKPAATEGQ
jgi:hypothetical protein